MPRTARIPTGDVELPRPGATYLVPLRDGRFGVCRVLRTTREDEFHFFGRRVLVATSAWYGAVPPALDDPALRSILVRTHHGCKAEPHLIFLDCPPPPEFRYLGELPPSEADQRAACKSLGFGWTSARELDAQWRWDHDRETVLAEDALAAASSARRDQERRAEEARRRAALTWPALRAKARFAGWEDRLDVDLVATSRRLFVEAIDALEPLGPRNRAKAKAAIERLVKGLNALHTKHHRFIETVERDAICAEIEELAFVAGLPNASTAADAWREW